MPARIISSAPVVSPSIALLAACAAGLGLRRMLPPQSGAAKED